MESLHRQQRWVLPVPSPASAILLSVSGSDHSQNLMQGNVHLICFLGVTCLALSNVLRAPLCCSIFRRLTYATQPSCLHDCWACRLGSSGIEPSTQPGPWSLKFQPRLNISKSHADSKAVPLGFS